MYGVMAPCWSHIVAMFAGRVMTSPAQAPALPLQVTPLGVMTRSPVCFRLILRFQRRSSGPRRHNGGRAHRKSRRTEIMGLDRRELVRVLIQSPDLAKLRALIDGATWGSGG